MKARSRLFPVAPEGSALRRCDPLRGHGALVAVGDLPGTGGDELAEELGAEIHKLDVTSEVDWDGVIRAVLSRHRTIDVLVNAAGLEGDVVCCALELTTLAEWRRIMTVNLMEPSWVAGRSCR